MTLVPKKGKRCSIAGSNKEGKSWLDKIYVSMLGQRKQVLREFVVSFLLF
jgi:hypothetical protein